MKSMHELINEVNFQCKNTDSDHPIFAKNENSVLPLFNAFFKSIRVIFPAILTVIKTQNDLNSFRAQWTAAFYENEINTLDIVNAGLMMVRRSTSPFLPSLGQFIKWCHQGISVQMGLPEANELIKLVLRYSACTDDYKYTSNAEYWLVTGLYHAMHKNELSDSAALKYAESLIINMAKKIASGYVPSPPILQITEMTEYRPLSAQESALKLSEIKRALKLNGYARQ